MPTYEYAIEEKKYRLPITKKERIKEWDDRYQQMVSRVVETEYKMWKHETLIAVRHIASGDVVVFKFYFHQGRWKWGDSRKSGSVPESDIELELARMLFGGDRQKAAALMEEASVEAQLAAL